ncbi:MAG TPA: DUF2192 domain-containing protein [Desulfosporosinus sp.]|nr:DUF2192 domain-containing protein [Desulfosporosinus sp.]
MSKKDLLKDLEELAAALKANAERADDKTETANNYFRGFYRGCSVADEISSNSLRHIITKHAISQG